MCVADLHVHRPRTFCEILFVWCVLVCNSAGERWGNGAETESDRGSCWHIPAGHMRRRPSPLGLKVGAPTSFQSRLAPIAVVADSRPHAWRQARSSLMMWMPWSV